MNDSTALILSLALAIAGLRMVKHSSASALWRITIGLWTFCWLFLLEFWFVANYFTGNGIDHAVLFHLRYGLDGAGLSEYLGIISSSMVLLLLAVIAGYLVYRFGWKYNRLQGGKFQSTAGVFLLVLGVALSPAVLDVSRIYLQNSPVEFQLEFSEEFSNYYIKPELPTDTPGKTPNLIYIYIESLERTYFDEKLFPGLIKGLRELEKDSVTFTNLIQLPMTGWTIAGMTASQCGIPLVFQGGNAMEGIDEFLPGATCMGDLLKEMGYQLDYMGGAPLEFAGKGNFYTSHGFDKVQGREELQEKLVDKDYHNGWGLYDDTLLDKAYSRFIELGEQEAPFGLFVLTLDTHHPHGHTSKSCEQIPYKDGSNSILNAVKCSDFIVSNFVKKVRSSKAGENTIIAIGSDHLAFRNQVYGKLKDARRRNLFMVNLPENLRDKYRKHINKGGSTLDIGPTLFQMMGVKMAGFGLGRSLLRPEKNLVQKGGSANRLLRLQQDINKLWQFPKVSEGLMVFEDNKEIHLEAGGRKIQAPALFQVSQSGRVTSITCDAKNATGLTDYLLELEADTPFVWVDDCQEVQVILSRETESAEEGLCVAIGKLGAESILIETVVNETELSGKKVMSAVKSFGKQQQDGALFASRQKRMRNLGAYGIPEITVMDVLDPELSIEELFIKSQGGIKGRSYVNVKRVGEETTLKVDRGMTLFGLGASKEPSLVKLAQADRFDSSSITEQQAAFAKEFTAAINDGQRFPYLLILAHDSFKCGGRVSLEKMLPGIEVENLQQPGFREPYILVVKDGNILYEDGGDKESSIVLLMQKKTPGKEPYLAADLESQ